MVVVVSSSGARCSKHTQPQQPFQMGVTDFSLDGLEVPCLNSLTKLMPSLDILLVWGGKRNMESVVAHTHSRPWSVSVMREKAKKTRLDKLTDRRCHGVLCFSSIVVGPQFCLPKRHNVEGTCLSFAHDFPISISCISYQEDLYHCCKVLAFTPDSSAHFSVTRRSTVNKPTNKVRKSFVACCTSSDHPRHALAPPASKHLETTFFHCVLKERRKGESNTDAFRSMTNARDSPSKASKGGSKNKNNKNNNQKKGDDNANALLSVKFPVNTVVELTLSPTRESVQGMVYCTDEITNTIVLKKSLTHTTLASEIRMINASSVLEKKVIQAAATPESENDDAAVVEGETDTASELPLPFQTTSRKAIEEREKRAIRSAEDSFRHINQKASPEGQAVFDRLLKACNEVVWRGESILVLGEVKVDPPYGKDNCKLVRSDHGSGSLNEGSLERVRNIVGATSSTKS